jgi:hypothetical protein
VNANVGTLRDLIIDQGLLGGETLSRALAVQTESGERLDAVLTRLGLVSEAALTETIAASAGLRIASAEAFAAASVIEGVSPRFLREVRALPLGESADGVEVAFADPVDPYPRRALAFALRRPVTPLAARASDIEAALDRLFGIASRSEAAGDEIADEADLERLKDLASDAPVSRAGIAQITRKLEQERVVIIGLGGTGAYTLDLLAKTPARRIDLYDGDRFLQHNAFRGPGAPSIELLREQPYKVDYWRAIYSNMHRGIVAHRQYLAGDNVDQLAGASIVFLCMDAGPAKSAIVRGLERLGLSFIDVGMGLELVDDQILGQVRVTSSTPIKRDHVWSGRVSMSNGGDDDLYSRNIQVADLNSLNASLAVGRWKRMLAFYLDLENEHHTVYAIDGNHLLNEEQQK